MSRRINSGVWQIPPRWKNIADGAAIAADVDDGNFNAIMNRSSAAVDVAVEYDDGTSEVIKDLQAGELLAVRGNKILRTGTSTSARDLYIGLIGT